MSNSSLPISYDGVGRKGSLTVKACAIAEEKKVSSAAIDGGGVGYGSRNFGLSVKEPVKDSSMELERDGV